MTIHAQTQSCLRPKIVAGLADMDNHIHVPSTYVMIDTWLASMVQVPNHRFVQILSILLRRAASSLVHWPPPSVYWCTYICTPDTHTSLLCARTHPPASHHPILPSHTAGTEIFFAGILQRSRITANIPCRNGKRLSLPFMTIRHTEDQDSLQITTGLQYTVSILLQRSMYPTRTLNLPATKAYGYEAFEALWISRPPAALAVINQSPPMGATHITDHPAHFSLDATQPQVSLLDRPSTASLATRTLPIQGLERHFLRLVQP